VIGRILLLVLIIGVIIGALFLGEGGTPTPVKTGAGEPSNAAGYSARNAEVTETGEDGRPAFVVLSPLIRQRPDDDRVQLDAPRMTFVSEANGTWKAQARAGQIQADGSNINLFGDVKLEGELSGTPVTISTSTIAFDTRTEIASTTAPVTFEGPGRSLSSTGGIVANLKDSELQLLSKIHGTFPAK
jgi:LPS export ABC transporter protein LptC